MAGNKKAPARAGAFLSEGKLIRIIVWLAVLAKIGAKDLVTVATSAFPVVA